MFNLQAALNSVSAFNKSPKVLTIGISAFIAQLLVSTYCKKFDGKTKDTKGGQDA